MKHKRNLIIGIVLSATAGFIALQSVNAPTPANEMIGAPDAVASELPTEESCYYVWAYRDADELTEMLDASLKAVHPEADIHATLFGEDCIYPDGRSTFTVMQTDFYVRMTVDAAANDATFGNWMARIMDIIIALPREEIQGPRSGYVEFEFIKTDSEHVIVRVPIDKYIIEAQGETGAELFQLFHSQP
jgi:hypothetical protein